MEPIPVSLPCKTVSSSSSSSSNNVAFKEIIPLGGQARGSILFPLPRFLNLKSIINFCKSTEDIWRGKK
jgi:hypothetical protein